MNESNKNQKNIILPYQQKTYERLCAFARACLCVDRRNIGSIKLRSNFLLLGPTGIGKTHLAKAVAEEMKVPFLAISAGDWIILGGNTRGSEVTWKVIISFIQRALQVGRAIIFIDEMDKIYHDSNWNSFLRSEIFSLCDARLPVGIDDDDDDDDDDATSPECVKKIGEFLKYNTMIIGGAAFQNIWEGNSKPLIGFGNSVHTNKPPEIHDLVKYLPRELINRFCSELLILPELKRSDYQAMIEAFSESVPEMWRCKFLEIGMHRLDDAVRHQKGARYAEEILLAAVVSERANLANWVPEVIENATEEVSKTTDSLDPFGIF